MERRSKGQYDDIKFSNFDTDLLFNLIVILVVCAIFYGLILLLIGDHYKETLKSNATAREFNSLSLSERQLINQWSGLKLDKKSPLMEIDDDPLQTQDVWLPLLFIMIGIVVIAMSLSVFYYYGRERGYRYFIADLPFDTAYGWFLFFAMFAAWPVLLVSAIRMRNYSRPKRKAEKAAVTEQAKVELSEEQVYNLAQSPKISHYYTARQTYIKYRVSSIVQAQQKLIEHVQAQIDDTKQDIRSYGDKIQLLQRQLGQKQAELNKLPSAKLSAQATRAEAKKEWELLTEMRGVAKLTAQESRGKKPDKIFILVKVRVPYENEVYDFGDYRIMLCGSTYECKRVRSGVRVDHNSTSPDYNESSGFCFGNRKYTITEYLEEGKVIEAVTLMIDCLHSVNEGDQIYIPDCFRKVATIERAKRRLRRQAKT